LSPKANAYVLDVKVNIIKHISFQAVDVVGQAGKPKTITGFQTHTTPVLLAYGERAELATDECILYICYTIRHNVTLLLNNLINLQSVVLDKTEICSI
jgi:hypothetical protein